MVYVSVDEGGWLARQTSQTASAVARARRRGGSVTADKKAGGSYVVAGYGLMPGPQVVVLQCRVGGDRGGKVAGKVSPPYTRRSTWAVRTAAAFAEAAPIMGYAADNMLELWPETLAEHSHAAREHPVVGDSFMFPSHAAQWYGLPGTGASTPAHQCALRLAGAHAKETSARVLSRVVVDTCGLHVDKNDGVRYHGGPIIYSPLCEVMTGAVTGASTATVATDATATNAMAPLCASMRC